MGVSADGSYTFELHALGIHRMVQYWYQYVSISSDILLTTDNHRTPWYQRLCRSWIYCLVVLSRHSQVDCTCLSMGSDCLGETTNQCPSSRYERISPTSVAQNRKIPRNKSRCRQTQVVWGILRRVFESTNSGTVSCSNRMAYLDFGPPSTRSHRSVEHVERTTHLCRWSHRYRHTRQRSPR